MVGEQVITCGVASKQQELIFLAVLEAGSLKSRCGEGHSLSEVSREDVSMPLAAAGDSSLPWLATLLPASAPVFMWPSARCVWTPQISLCLSLLRTPVAELGTHAGFQDDITLRSLT